MKKEETFPQRNKLELKDESNANHGICCPTLQVQSRDKESIALDKSSETSSSCYMLSKRNNNFERVMFFDLDNTLYSKGTGIAEQMGTRIQLYFEQFLHLPKEESSRLGQRYYLDYGLAIKGLIRHFQIDPLKYDAFVDGGLQVDSILKPDVNLTNLLSQMQARKWIFTNAGLQHALRVLKLLQIEDHFEGIVYCNYSEEGFPAKPDRLAYERAMQCAGVEGRPDLCYFVDDNGSNVRTAREIGWQAILLDEENPLNDPLVEIGNLFDLPKVLADLYILDK